MRIVALCGAVLFSLSVAAQTIYEPEAEKANTTLNEVLVTGEFPGPGLWKLTKQVEDSEHVLWILGNSGPIPKAISWRSRDVERIIAESQEFIGDSSVGITLENKIGIFKTLFMAPSLLKSRHNPNEQYLKDLVPAELYERWVIQKAKYIGHDNGIEKWRPTFAGDKLKNAALKVVGSTFSYPTWAVIYKITKEKKIKITTPGIMVKIPNDKIKSTLKQFLQSPLQDVACFSKAIAMVEALGDADTMRMRGVAWATGDLTALRELPDFPNVQPECEGALLNSQAIKDLVLVGSDNLPAQLEQLWLDATETALANNRSTFTVLPMAELFNPSGRLAQLRAKGYLIEEPQQID